MATMRSFSRFGNREWAREEDLGLELGNQIEAVSGYTTWMCGMEFF